LTHARVKEAVNKVVNATLHDLESCELL